MNQHFPNAPALRRLTSADIDTVQQIIIAADDSENPGHPVRETAASRVWIVLGQAPANVAPTGSVMINGGNSETNTLAVTLTITGSADAYQMQVSNASDFSGAVWETFATSKAWQLSAGADGTRTVYLKLRDAQLAESYVYQDSISYTTDLPTATVSGTPSSPTSATMADITVGGTGVTHYKCRVDSGAWGEQTAVSEHISLSGLSNAIHVVDVIGYDGADWQSEANPTTVSWTVDTVAPVTSASPAGGSYSGAQSVALSGNKSVLGTYFTTDGATPEYPAAGTTQTYSGPITVGSSTTLKFFSRSLAGVAETVKSQSYTILGSNQAPGTPSSLLAGTYLTNGTGFTLSWTAATDADGTVAFYKVYKAGVLYQTNVSATSLAITGQTAGSNAQWTVSAVDNLGAEGNQSTGLSVTTIPPAPTGHSLVGGDGQVVHHPGSATGATSYNAYYTTDGSTPTTGSTKLTGVTDAQTTTITNGTLTKVIYTAVNAAGESAISTVVSVTPSTYFFWQGGWESNPTIETYAGFGSAQVDHVYANGSGTRTVSVVTSPVRSGTYAGQVYLNGANAAGDFHQRIQGADRLLASEFFDMWWRIDSSSSASFTDGSTQGAIGIGIGVNDSGLNSVLAAGTVDFFRLYGSKSVGSNGNDDTYRQGSAARDTWIHTAINLKQWILDHLAAGKTWSDVYAIAFYPGVWCGSVYPITVQFDDLK